MRRDEVIYWLRQLRGMKAQVRNLQQSVDRIEEALETLDECERDIIGTMYVFPETHASEKICEKFMIERSAVYRRRQKALEKLENYLGEMGDKSGTTNR